MIKYIMFSIGGFAFGVVLTLFFLPGMMAEEMLKTRESRLSFEETVIAIEESAKANGWKVPKIYDIRGSLDKEGFEIDSLKVISICSPEHAYNILSADERKKVSAIIPCRISVFKNSKGEVKIAQMNSAMMSRMFGGAIGEVMSEVSIETSNIIKDIVKEI